MKVSMNVRKQLNLLQQNKEYQNKCKTRLKNCPILLQKGKIKSSNGLIFDSHALP